MKKIWSLCSLAALILGGFLFSSANAQVFQNTYSVNGRTINFSSVAHASIQLSNNVFVSTGSIYDPLSGNSNVFLAKTDSLGSIFWFKELGTPENDEKGIAICRSPNANAVVVTGQIWNNSVTPEADILVFKFDMDLNTIDWSARYETSGIDTYNEVGNRVVPLYIQGDLSYLVLGNTQMNHQVAGRVSKPCALTVKDADGTIIWSRRYQEFSEILSQRFHNAKELILTGTNNKYMVADTWGDNVFPFDRSLALFTIDANTGAQGNLNTFNFGAFGPNGEGTLDLASIDRLKNNGEFSGYVVSASMHGTPYNRTAIVAMRLDPLLAPVWARAYNRPAFHGNWSRGIFQNHQTRNRIDLFTTFDSPALSPSNLQSFLTIKVGNGALSSIRDYGRGEFIGHSMVRNKLEPGYTWQSTHSFFVGGLLNGVWEMGKVDSTGVSGCDTVSNIQVYPLTPVTQLIEFDSVQWGVSEDYVLTVSDLNTSVVDCSGVPVLRKAVQAGSETEDAKEAPLLSVFPNPLGADVDHLQVEYRVQQAGKTTIALRNILGQLVFQQTLWLSEGMQTIVIPSVGLSAGVNFLEIQVEGMEQATEVVKVIRVE